MSKANPCQLPAKNSPEDAFAAKLDMCLTDGVIKTGSGIIIGGIASLLFFKRRRWPVIAGMGMGVGLAWANCEFELNTAAKNKA